MAKIFNCGDQVGSSTVNTISVVKIRSYRWLNIWNIVKEPLIVRTELKKYCIKLCSFKLYAGGKVKKYTVDCSVNAEESLGRENKGDKCLLRFCLPLTTRKRSGRLLSSWACMEKYSWLSITRTLTNSSLALTQTKIGFLLDFLSPYIYCNFTLGNSKPSYSNLALTQSHFFSAFRPFLW